MHLDHSRGKKKKREKEKKNEPAFFFFYLQMESQCLFVVLMHPLPALFGLKGCLVWCWGFFKFFFGGGNDRFGDFFGLDYLFI